MKKKLLYIGHSYHSKTKSSQFMMDYLKEFFDVAEIFDDSWDTGISLDYSCITSDYTAVVFWQLLPDVEIFKLINHDNIIYFPMYDQSFRWDYDLWKNYSRCKIINFSKTLQDKLSKWGFNSIYLQYFIEPKEFNSGNKNEIFFWQRINSLNINTVEKLLPQDGLKLHIHKAVDPDKKFVQPDLQSEEKYSITYSEWLGNKNEMQDLIKFKGIYVAPREFEGIGMSFLEAMAMGKAVIAVNQPTMNEYIQDGITGYLFDLKNPKPINLSKITQIQKNAYKYMKKGYQNWLKNRYKIIEFIL